MRRALPLLALALACDGHGSRSDTTPPVIHSFSPSASQHDLYQDVGFLGAASDNVGIALEGVDVDGTVDADGDGNPDNDRDLPFLTATLAGGYALPGRYVTTGWVVDRSNNVASSQAGLVVKPYREFAEVQDSLLSLAASRFLVSQPIDFSSWRQTVSAS